MVYSVLFRGDVKILLAAAKMLQHLTPIYVLSYVKWMQSAAKYRCCSHLILTAPLMCCKLTIRKRAMALCTKNMREQHDKRSGITKNIHFHQTSPIDIFLWFMTYQRAVWRRIFFFFQI